MKISNVKAGLQSSLSSLLTNLKDGRVDEKADFGNFFCSVETFDNFAMVQRRFKTSGDSLFIPFSCDYPSVQMIFSLDGQTFLNNRIDPFFLGRSSHCINFFKGYNCTNLLHTRSQQHDVVFRLKKGFYTDLITQYLSSAEDHLPAMILQEKEFNTINKHLPTDAAISGILKNILECPFNGEMRSVFIREHLRALLMLQLFHFSSIVTGKPPRIDTKITLRDRDILYDVKQYIDQHFLDPTSLESLSRHFGLNEFKLKHGFKSLFDTSPIKYLHYKRLTFSLFLLRETDKTIKEIAHEIGYSHPSNFTTAFMKMFGNPPQHYRQLKEVSFA